VREAQRPQGAGGVVCRYCLSSRFPPSRRESPPPVAKKGKKKEKKKEENQKPKNATKQKIEKIFYN
jgi:hypothetical protein